MEWQKEDTIVKFEHQVIEKIAKIGGHLFCQTDTPLFYENHIPIVAYLLKKGGIEVGVGKKKLFLLTPGEVLGLHEFHQNTPSLFWAKALKGSELVYIDKSTLNELLNDGPRQIQEALCTVLEV